MGRSWGTNLMIPNPSLLVAASDVPVPSGAKTTVLDSGASPLIAAGAGGGFFLLAHLTLEILLGATAPTAMVVTLDLNTAGANQDSYTVAPGILVNSATILVACTLYVPTSGTVWFPTGDRVLITVNPTAQAVTAKASGSRCVLALQQGL
jgi:hypothetical protein